MARDDNDRFAVWRDGNGEYTVLFFCNGWRYAGDTSVPPEYKLVFGDVSYDEAVGWLKVFGVTDIASACVEDYEGETDG